MITWISGGITVRSTLDNNDDGEGCRSSSSLDDCALLLLVGARCCLGISAESCQGVVGLDCQFFSCGQSVRGIDGSAGAEMRSTLKRRPQNQPRRLMKEGFSRTYVVDRNYCFINLVSRCQLQPCYFLCQVIAR